MHPNTLLTIAALGAVTSAFDLPDNLRQIYDNNRVDSLFSANLVISNIMAFNSPVTAKMRYPIRFKAARSTVAISQMLSS